MSQYYDIPVIITIFYCYFLCNFLPFNLSSAENQHENEEDMSIHYFLSQITSINDFDIFIARIFYIMK